MGCIANPMTFYVPGLDAAAPHERAFYERSFSGQSNIRTGVFHHDGLQAIYYDAPAPVEKARITACSGLNTHVIVTPAHIEQMNAAGISVKWLTLPKIDNGGPMMEGYKNIFREFMTSPRSPLKSMRQANTPNVFIGHSTGSYLFLDLMQEHRAGKRLAQNFTFAVHVAAFLDCANASEHHTSKMRQIAFKTYMGLRPDRAPTQRVLSGGYVRMSKLIDEARDEMFAQTGSESSRIKFLKEFCRLACASALDTQNIVSTCGQILELQAHGQHLVRNFNPHAAARIPTAFIIPDADKFACHLTTTDIALQMGAEIIEAKGAGHDPLQTHPILVDMLINRIHDCKAQKSFVQKPALTTCWQPTEEEKLPDIVLPLRDRARFALQRGTGYLNTAAGLF